MRTFSRGYYQTDTAFEPFTGLYASMDAGSFFELHDSGADTYPVVLKVKNRHVCVYPNGAMPAGTVALPRTTFNGLSLTAGKNYSVLVAKPNAVRLLIENNILSFENVEQAL